MRFLDILKINCQQATCLHTKQKEGRLSLSERIGLKIHLAYCSLCRLFFAQIDVIEKQTSEISKIENNKQQLTEEEKLSMKTTLERTH